MLLFLLLVFLPAVPIETEVVRTLANCRGFLAEETPPEIPNILVQGNIQDKNRYKVICQTFNNKRRFLTLYDTKNKIPVFSAYRFTGAQPGRPKGNIWKIEPQLENLTEDKNMRMLQKSDTPRNQATNSSYNNIRGFDRGHLYPNSHAPDREAKLSTFTLTNAVPQVASFNRGNWNQIEQKAKCYMEKDCINANGTMEVFVVTGAEPGKEKPNEINIPSRMWSAFCCYKSKPICLESKAYWGPNKDKGNVIPGFPRDIQANFGINIFPAMSFKNNLDANRTHFCDKEYPFLLEITTDTAPPSTTDTSPAEETFPPNSTPTSPMMPKTTSTLAAATKTTQPTTITSTSTCVSNQEGCEDIEETNRKRWRS